MIERNNGGVMAAVHADDSRGVPRDRRAICESVAQQVHALNHFYDLEQLYAPETIDTDTRDNYAGSPAHRNTRDRVQVKPPRWITQYPVHWVTQ